MLVESRLGGKGGCGGKELQVKRTKSRRGWGWGHGFWKEGSGLVCVTLLYLEESRRDLPRRLLKEAHGVPKREAGDRVAAKG